MDIGGVIMIIVLLLAPVGILASGGIGAAILGFLLNDEVDERHEGSELKEIW